MEKFYLSMAYRPYVCGYMKGATKVLVVFLMLITTVSNSLGQSYGLQFSGHNVPLNERTELYLTPSKPLPFEEEFELSFDFRFQPNSESYFSYIFRVLIGDQNIDFIHGLLPGSSDNFQLVFSKRPSNISFHIPIETLVSEWTKFQFQFNLKEGIVKCVLEDTVLIDKIEGYDSSEGARLFFGAHEHGHFTTTDVAEMKIKDVQFKTDKRNYNWPLKEISGEVVHEINHSKSGIVKHPRWLQSLHSSWNKIASMELKGRAQTAFNQEEDLIYIVTSTSLLSVNLRDASILNEEYNRPFNVIHSADLIFDPVSRRLLSYSIDQDYKSYYDFDKNTWPEFSRDTAKLTNYWHHNSLIHPDGNLYIFGGYGNHLYKNMVLKSEPESSGFDSVSYRGEFFPRYLAAAAYTEKENKMYLIGGYGSKQGKQTMSPDYYYELLEYSFEDSTFTRLYDCSETYQEFCFANTAVIDDHNQMYALSFSKYLFDNEIQLIKINLDNPGIEKLGSQIDFKFTDVKSNAVLYYSSVSDKLLAVISYFDEGKTSVEVYTISFPPVKSVWNENIANKRRSMMRWLLYIAIPLVLFLTLLIFHLVRLKNRKANRESKKDDKVLENVKFETKRKEPDKSSIILFGGFQVIDMEGNDITGSFTPLLKNLLLFILLSSLKQNKGVSSQILSETFWFDKSTESARNNRAVNIVKLKTLLDKVGKATISKDTGYWKFEYDTSTINIDFANYLNILGKDTDLNKDDVSFLLSIIDKGQFLLNINAEWLDVYKSEVSNEIIDALVAFIAKSKPEPDFILHLANCMFTFDIASEEAMILQCQTLFKLGKHSLAKKSYAKFVKEYTILYDEEFSRSFTSIVDSVKEK